MISYILLILAVGSLQFYFFPKWLQESSKDSQESFQRHRFSNQVQRFYRYKNSKTFRMVLATIVIFFFIGISLNAISFGMIGNHFYIVAILLAVANLPIIFIDWRRSGWIETGMIMAMVAMIALVFLLYLIHITGLLIANLF